ncbi:hypothetical protein DEFDS_P167 (plasmid) [Deferribacter desulfuricans SSM1]|uniref:diguanylate cyclase n=1 Tax=Deferribacter desulfuricans (strain DSM 14783 / JCM 11476 / NBRC 101012 / SSM1) TaxID=639282 RepID=D3PEZ5_DEFDS|nr:GGDEF domain-containing protein [Deferribacter desulfuricans]BAI81787.1 hypothetical protein DEFDS_P167 [Deferribacter desulfuricans SSM1]
MLQKTNIDQKTNLDKLYTDITTEIIKILLEIRKNNQSMTPVLIKSYLKKSSVINNIINTGTNTEIQTPIGLNEYKNKLNVLFNKVLDYLPKNQINQFKDRIEEIQSAEDFNDLFLDIISYFITYLIKIINIFEKTWDILKDIINHMDNVNEQFIQIIDNSKQIFMEEIKNIDKIDNYIDSMKQDTLIESDLKSLKKKLLEKIILIKTELKNNKNKQKEQVSKLTLNKTQIQVNIDKYVQSIEQLQKELEQIKRESEIDTLTNVFNRNTFDKYIVKAIDRFKKHNESVSVIMLDIDDFKKINDNYGHLVGDSVLRNFAAILKNSVRNSDLIFRYGGEEFIIVLPETKISQALSISERILKELNKTSFKLKKDSLKVTASMGVTESKMEDNVETLLKRVDNYLYKSKATGKNKITSDFNYNM